MSTAVGIAARRGTGVRSPRWCVRINEPFGWLVLTGAKSLETRVDFKKDPQHLPGLSSGTIVLVLLDEGAFPPNASVKAREQTRVDIAELLSRQNKCTGSGPTKEQSGTICGWIQVGKSFALNEHEVSCRGGWKEIEDRTLLKRDNLLFKGNPQSCRWAIEVLRGGLLRNPIQLTEDALMAKGLFPCPGDHVLNADLLPMPPGLMPTAAVPGPCPAITARPVGLMSGSFSQAARRVLPREQQSGGSSSASSAAVNPPTSRPAGRASKAAGNLSSKQIGKLPAPAATAAPAPAPASASASASAPAPAAASAPAPAPTPTPAPAPTPTPTPAAASAPPAPTPKLVKKELSKEARKQNQTKFKGEESVARPPRTIAELSAIPDGDILAPGMVFLTRAEAELTLAELFEKHRKNYKL